MDDARLTTLSRRRNATVVTTYVLFVAKFDLLAVDDYFRNAVVRSVTLFCLSAVILLVSFFAVVLTVDRELRRPAAGAMAAPFGVMAVAALPFAATAALVALDLLSFARLDVWFPWVVAALLSFVFLAVYVVLFCCSLLSLFVATGFHFFVGEAHPVLPPLLTAVTVWLLILFDVTGIQDRIFMAVFDDAQPSRSTASSVLATVTAAALTAYAVAEIRRLHHLGHRLRTGPWG